METSHSVPNVKRLIMVPALIALAITIFRLVGELVGGSSVFFNRDAGGGGALVGIVWLVPIFGVYFAIKLVRQGFGPASAGKVIGLSVAGLVIAGVAIFLAFALTGDPNVSVSLGGAIGFQLGIAIASLVVVLILRKGWPAFFQTMLSYAFASRIPVLIVMLVAMLGNWGTHYELGPAGYPEMGFLTKFILIALFPQMTFWIMFTMVFGTLFGGIAAALVRPKVTAEADVDVAQPLEEADEGVAPAPDNDPEKAEDTP
ncbi:MAG: hypothetical protein IH937_10750 [Acidobacteria bacterium]|nr:hypothetical protein [Acidobacteriota bacterium]